MDQLEDKLWKVQKRLGISVSNGQNLGLWAPTGAKLHHCTQLQMTYFSIYKLCKWGHAHSYMSYAVCYTELAVLAQSLLGANPAVLLTSYNTKGFVEEKDECPLGQLYIHMCAVRSAYPINNPHIVSPIKHIVYATGAACDSFSVS